MCPQLRYFNLDVKNKQFGQVNNYQGKKSKIKKIPILSLDNHCKNGPKYEKASPKTYMTGRFS